MIVLSVKYQCDILQNVVEDGFDVQRVMVMQIRSMHYNSIGQQDLRLYWEQHRDWHICMKGVELA
jgi:hypothetical protein